MTYFFKTLSSADSNYEIYDKELLVIIRCFEKWRAELQSINNLVKVLTDHKSLIYFMFIKKLNRRQTKWVELLADFDFEITYQAEKIHDKADALTRRSGDRSENEIDERNKHMYQILLSINRLDDKVKKDLVNNLKKKVNNLQLFERVIKLNQKDIFCIEMKKIIKTRKHSYCQNPDINRHLTEHHVTRRYRR
jgi:hypothetical protein